MVWGGELRDEGFGYGKEETSLTLTAVVPIIPVSKPLRGSWY